MLLISLLSLSAIAKFVIALVEFSMNAPSFLSYQNISVSIMLHREPLHLSFQSKKDKQYLFLASICEYKLMKPLKFKKVSFFS